MSTKTLYLLRHAKSSWDDPGLSDFERPLAARGRRASRAMAEHLAATGVHPGLVLCSAAVRTRETHTRLADALGDVSVSFEEELYGAGARDLIRRLRGLPDSLSSVMLIGHNPGLQDLALVLLAEHGHDSSLERLERKVPTGALATLEVPTASWRALAPGSCRLISFVRPADLDAG